MNENLINEINKRISELENQINQAEKTIRENEGDLVSSNSNLRIEEERKALNAFNEELRKNQENLEIAKTVQIILRDLPGLQKQIKTTENAIATVDAEIESYKKADKEVPADVLKRKDNLVKAYRKSKNQEKVYLKYLNKGNELLPSLYAAYGIEVEEKNKNIEKVEPKVSIVSEKEKLEKELKASADRMKEYKDGGFDEQYANERANYSRLVEELSKFNKKEDKGFKTAGQRTIDGYSKEELAKFLESYKDLDDDAQIPNSSFGRLNIGYARERYNELVAETQNEEQETKNELTNVFHGDIGEGMPTPEEQFKQATGIDFDPNKYEIVYDGAKNELNDESYTPFIIVEKMPEEVKINEEVKSNKEETANKQETTIKNEETDKNDETVKGEEPWSKGGETFDDNLISEINKKLERYADDAVKTASEKNEKVDEFLPPVPIIKEDDKNNALVVKGEDRISLKTRIKKLLLKLAAPFKAIYRAIKNAFAKRNNAKDARKRAQEVIDKDRQVLANSAKERRDRQRESLFVDLRVEEPENNTILKEYNSDDFRYEPIYDDNKKTNKKHYEGELKYDNIETPSNKNKDNEKEIDLIDISTKNQTKNDKDDDFDK